MALDEDASLSEFYDKYTGLNKRLLRTVGLWPQDETREEPVHRRVLTLAFLLNLIGLTSTQFYHIYLTWGNLFDCLEIMCNTTTSLLIIYKSVNFLYKRKIILEFESLSRKMWMEEFRDESNRRMMIDDAKTGNRLTRLFALTVILTVTNFQLAPVVSFINQWRDGVPKGDIVYVLPYLIMLPGDLRNPVDHALAYIPITILSVCLFYYIVGVDSFYFVWIQHIILHLKLLQKDLVQLGRLRNDYDAKSVTDRVGLCIRKHNLIIHHCEILEETYSSVILGLCVLSTLSMCMVIFHTVVTMGGHNGNLSLFLMYLAMEVSEVLLYCWFGNSLILQSLEVGSAIYNSNWYEDRPNKGAFIRTIQIMMIRTQKPIRLTAYKFADVSLELFTNIMSSTASYFALLKTLYDN